MSGKELGRRRIKNAKLRQDFLVMVRHKCAKRVKFWAADPKAEHVGKGRVAMTGEEALSVGREEQTWQPHITHSQPLVTRVIKC